MTYLEIIDTAIKIGLGALITGICTYWNQKSHSNHLKEKENYEYNRKLLEQVSNDIEHITHLALKIWSHMIVEVQKEVIDRHSIAQRVNPLKTEIADEFNRLSKSEGLLLLYGYSEQQIQLRKFGELIGSFISYSSSKYDLPVTLENTNEFRNLILKERKQLYQSLNQALQLNQSSQP